MAERKLGQGLEALLGHAATGDEEQIVRLTLTEIQGGPHQPRQDFDPTSLSELAASIRENGILQPVIVRPGGAGYEVVAGERRVRAARLAGLTEIPAVVRRYSDDEVLVLSLVENIQRTDLNAIDKALAFRRLSTHLGATHQEIAQRLGVDRTSITHMLRLLELPPEIQALVREGSLSAGHGRAVLGIRDQKAQLDLAARIVREELSVRAAEELARGGRPAQPRRRSQPRKTPQVVALETELRRLLGTKVQIRDRRGKGKIVVEYYSPEEFERILGLLRGAEHGFGVAEGVRAPQV
ncbi:MAG: ParB/RepB/Spo0J family partition protein [Planctomycetota bacterium]|jgi:ParB family chromosome partitioning protein